MRVAHLETGAHLYGGARQVAYLMAGVAGHGIQQVLVCLPGSAIGEAAAAAGLPVHPVAYRGDLDMRLAARVRAILRDTRSDILHVHSRKGADTWGPLGAAGLGVPVIVTRRVDNPDHRLLVALRRRLTARFVAISEGVREAMVADGIPAERISVIHSAVDLAAYRPREAPCGLRRAYGLPDRGPVIGVIAQLIERKGHRVFLEVLPGLLARFAGLHVLFFGKGPLEAPLKALAARLGVAERVVFAGFDPAMSDHIPCLDLVVHPAFKEGLGVSLLEAAACGVPVVAGRAGGIPEVVRDGVNGILVPPGDRDALFGSVTRLLEDSQARAAMGRAGRALVEREFSIGAMTAAYLRLYADTMQGETR